MLGELGRGASFALLDGGGDSRRWVFLGVMYFFIAVAVITISQRDRLCDWLHKRTGRSLFDRTCDERGSERDALVVILPAFLALFSMLIAVGALS